MLVRCAKSGWCASRIEGQATATDPDAPAALDLARALLRDTREELVRADEKASSLLTAVGIAVGALLTGVVGRIWSPAGFDQLARIAWWVGVAGVGAATCFLVSALLPRFRRSEGTARVTYFADVIRAENAKGRARPGAVMSDLEAAVKSSANNALAHTLQQLRAISWIVSVKYRRIRAAILSLAVAVAFLGIALALQAISRG